ncbi:uncharacterized protein [Pocillopora verrucosa]|uniref:uncharacterized protein n=1 Tax=Pocillopora verrucosa TaxID=203993 RepID=UPI0033400132
MWQNGKYNNIRCQEINSGENPGYICEKQVNCSTISKNSKNGDIFIERKTRPRSTPQPLVTTTTSTSSLITQSANTQNKQLSEGSSRRPQSPESTPFKESTTKVEKPNTPPANTTFSTLQNRHTFKSPTQGTTFKNTVGESSPQNGSTRGLNLVLIVIVLLAIFLLAIAVVFGISFFRRHQGHKNQDHLRDRVTCTYEVPPSSELQSIDPVLGQQIQSSAEVTVHLTLSQTESRPITHDPASDCKKECEHDHLDETNRKSWSMSEGCSDIQEKARENTVLVSDEKGIQQPLALCDKKEEGKDYVYAVVHKERKSGVSSEASTLKKSSDRPQEGTGLPVNRRSCVDCNDHSSHSTDLGLDKNTEAAESETLQAGGNSEYLYAAVEKTKKKKPPQKPPPYRGLVYADLIHSRESSAKLVKEQSQTVYAQIDHAKTASVMTSQHNLEGKKKGEHH